MTKNIILQSKIDEEPIYKKKLNLQWKKNKSEENNPKAVCKAFCKTSFGRYVSYGHDNNGIISNASLPCPI